MAENTVHLLVLIHGMWGKPDHLAEMHRIFDETHCQSESQPGPNGELVHILLAQTNRESSTYDGIDWGGERVAEEVRFLHFLLSAPAYSAANYPSQSSL